MAAEDEDHEDLVEALEQIDAMQNATPDSNNSKPYQPPKKRHHKLSMQPIHSIVAESKAVTIELPELDLPTADDWVAVWPLIDNGSPAHVVDAEQVFPNAKVDPPPPGHRGFKAADGTSIPHKSFATTEAKTNEGHTFTITWKKNAAVGMPILSTHELAMNKDILEYDIDEELVHHKPTGKMTEFIRRHGVYFVKLFFNIGIAGTYEMVFKGRENLHDANETVRPHSCVSVSQSEGRCDEGLQADPQDENVDLAELHRALQEKQIGAEQDGKEDDAPKAVPVPSPPTMTPN